MRSWSSKINGKKELIVSRAAVRRTYVLCVEPHYKGRKVNASAWARANNQTNKTFTVAMKTFYIATNKTGWLINELRFIPEWLINFVKIVSTNWIHLAFTWFRKCSFWRTANNAVLVTMAIFQHFPVKNGRNIN